MDIGLFWSRILWCKVGIPQGQEGVENPYMGMLYDFFFVIYNTCIWEIILLVVSRISCIALIGLGSSRFSRVTHGRVLEF